MTTLTAIARAVRPFTRKIDWVILSLAIWGLIIHGVLR